MTDGAFVTRFAPSPTGLLHLGHACSALTAFNAARQASGRFVLRIEDIDATRCRTLFEDAIYEDLAWLGLTWETPVRRQSEHTDDYRAALERLIHKGLAYRCFRTRREVLEAMASAPHGPAEVFRGGPLPEAEEAARIAAREPYAWRLSLAAAQAALGPGFESLIFTDQIRGETIARPQLAGDIVLARKDVGVAYHLAVVLDDAYQQISHVTRGEDLLPATHVQRLLQALLGLPEPVYLHHPLVLDAQGRRLAKRHDALAVAALRQAGLSAAEVLARLDAVVGSDGRGRPTCPPGWAAPRRGE